jgi:hypothetical protein
MRQLARAIYEFCEEHHPVSCRQCFYAMVILGLIQKSEQEYNRTIVRLLTEMRLRWFDEEFEGAEESGKPTIPMWWIADASRWKHQATTYRDLRSGMNALTRHYGVRTGTGPTRTWNCGWRKRPWPRS